MSRAPRLNRPSKSERKRRQRLKADVLEKGLHVPVLPPRDPKARMTAAEIAQAAGTAAGNSSAAAESTSVGTSGDSEVVESLGVVECPAVADPPSAVASTTTQNEITITKCTEESVKTISYTTTEEDVQAIVGTPVVVKHSSTEMEVDLKIRFKIRITVSSSTELENSSAIKPEDPPVIKLEDPFMTDDSVYETCDAFDSDSDSIE